jgi:hypothetical protein
MRSFVTFCTVSFLVAVWIGCNGQVTPSETVGGETISATKNPLDYYREGYPTEFSEMESALAERYSAPKSNDLVQFLNYVEAFLDKTEAEWTDPNDEAWTTLADCRSLLFALYYSVEKSHDRGKTQISDAMLDAAIATAEKINDPMRRAEVFLRIARTTGPIDALTRDGWGTSRYQLPMDRMAVSLRKSNTAFWEKDDQEAMQQLGFYLARVEQSQNDVAHPSQYEVIQKMNPDDFSNDQSPWRFPDTKTDWLKLTVKSLIFRSPTHRDMNRALEIAKDQGGSDYLKDWILPMGDLLAQRMKLWNLEMLAGILEPDERLYFLEHLLHNPANPLDYQSRAINLMFETLEQLPDDFVSANLRESSPLGVDEDKENPAAKRELLIRALRWRIRIGQPDVALEDMQRIGGDFPEDIPAVVESPETMIDYLELCQCLSQEERDILKRYPVICDALMVINRSPRYLQYHVYRGPFHCGSLKDIAIALAEIGDKEAAGVALRLTHKAFVDMPLMDSVSFFDGLQPDLTHDAIGFTADEIYSQEFLDNLIVRCQDDFSDYLYRGHYEDGNDRFRNTLRKLVESMKSYRRMQDDTQLEKALHWIARLPQNKSCEGMRKELFFNLFRDFPIEKATVPVDALSDPDTKKEFSGYLAELKEFQQREGVRNNLVGGYPKINEPPNREEIQALIKTTTDPFQRCEAMLTLAMDDLEKGNISQAVKLAREAAKSYDELDANSQKTQGPAHRIGTMRGIEKFYSRLATTLAQGGRYAEAVDYLVEGAGKFSEEFNYQWNSFLIPPLRELHTAVRDNAVRATVRKKLQTLLQSSKDCKTVAQSQQLRAVLEMQIALGFEEDAVPVLKTTKFVEKDKERNTYSEPLWDGMTAAKFQLRCGLFDEAMKTYSQIAFRDSSLRSDASATDRTVFLHNLIVMSLVRNEYDHAKKIIGWIQQEDLKPPMLILLARAYQKSGDPAKAMEVVSALEPADFRHQGYLSLLRDFLADDLHREQNEKSITMLRDRYCEEIKITDDPTKQYKQYSAVIALLYWNDRREEAMRILDEIDSPHVAAWILLNLVADHEMDAQRHFRTQGMMSIREWNTQQIYPDYYTEEQLVMEEYASPNHYLNLTSAVKSAEEILKQVAEKRRGNVARRETPFEPDKVAMRILLDKILTVTGKVNDPARRANILAAVGKMEWIYFSKEVANKHFYEALDLLKSEKAESNPSQTASQLALFFKELGEKEKALESIQIAVFGYVPDESAEELTTNPAVLDRLRGNVYLLESLARNGGAESACQLFLPVYERVDDYAKPQQLATLQITAMFHDSRHPDNPMLPKAKEQYRDFFGQMIREVNNKKEGYEKQSALHHILFGWMNCEKRIQAVRAEIENQAETGGKSSEITEKHIQSRQLGYGNSFHEFGFPFYEEPVFYE